MTHCAIRRVLIILDGDMLAWGMCRIVLSLFRFFLLFHKFFIFIGESGFVWHITLSARISATTPLAIFCHIL
jgi:hypothetical protein